MSVEKYGKGWRYRFDLGPDPLTGKRRQATRGGFATKREATTAMNEAMQASRNGRFVRRSAQTVRGFFTEWLSARRLSLKPSTWQSYQDYAKSYVEPILGDTKLSELTAQRLNLLYVHLLENGRCKADRNVIMYGYWKSAIASGDEEPKAHTLAEIGGVTYDAARKALIRYRAGRVPTPKQDGLSPKTVRNVHTMLTAALSDAVQWDYIPRNPATDAKPPRAPRTVREVWTAEQLRRFITQVRSDRFYALWLLVCTTGLRRGELAGLRRNGVDLDNGRITNSTTRVVVGGRAEDSDTKTQSSRRSVALDPMTLDALRSYVDFGTSSVLSSSTRAPSCSAGPTVAPSVQKLSATGLLNTPSPPDCRHTATRRQTQLRHCRAACGRTSQSGQRTTRTLLRRLHTTGLHARHPRHGCRGCAARSHGHPRDGLRTQLIQRRRPGDVLAFLEK
jgi:integrase